MPVTLSAVAIVAAISISYLFYFAGGLDGFVIGWTAVLAGLGVVFAFIIITLTE